MDERVMGEHEIRNALVVENAYLRAELEQERLQHAGCLTAAEGWAGKEPPRKGDYGWSVAFEKTLELRQKYEAALLQVREYEKRIPELCAEYLKKLEDAVRLINEMKAAILALMVNRAANANHINPEVRLGLNVDVLMLLESFVTDKPVESAPKKCDQCDETSAATETGGR